MSPFLGDRSAVASKPRDFPTLKAKQSAKIAEVRGALVAEGFSTLDEQARVLGLARSTTWTILTAQHKASGLSADIVNRILAAPQLPQLVRQKVFEYVEEKANGLYGHSKSQQYRFLAQLTVTSLQDGDTIASSLTERIKRPLQRSYAALDADWPPNDSGHRRWRKLASRKFAGAK
jgi:hypothetical protein